MARHGCYPSFSFPLCPKQVPTGMKASSYCIDTFLSILLLTSPTVYVFGINRLYAYIYYIYIALNNIFTVYADQSIHFQQCLDMLYIYMSCMLPHCCVRINGCKSFFLKPSSCSSYYPIYFMQIYIHACVTILVFNFFT